MTRRQVRGMGLVLLALLLIGLVVAQATRDVTPPSLWIETETRVETASNLEVLVSADEPATFEVTYGDARLVVVDQEVRTTFTVIQGAVPLIVTARDAAGNLTVEQRTITGVTLAQPNITVSGGSLPGRAFTIEIANEVEGSSLETPRLRIEGRAAPLFDMGTRRFALGATPLTVEAGFVGLSLTWTDALGRDAARTSSVSFGPIPGEVEELNIPASTLSVITPEARELENAVIAAAAADPSDLPRWSEPFVLPIEGRNTSGYAVPRRYAPGGPVSFHVGEDIAAPVGTPVAATNAGVVRAAGMYPIKGGMVILDHGAGVTSRYYHLSTIAVSEGQTVARGELLGGVGSTGLSTGPHLHWEIRVADAPTDPLAWVGRVRP